MIYRRFGRTELQMPIFSCGGMRYQQAWKDLEESEIEKKVQDNVEAIVLRALELGINHIETARGYGSSEMQLGKILPGLDREKLIVQTKIRPMASREEFEKTFELSMSLLGLDYVDLIALHGVNNADELKTALKEDGSLAVLQQARKEGRIGHIGFSTHGSPESNVAAIETGLFDYVNLHWYYIDQSNLPAIEAAAKQDMGVFIISPSDKGGHLYNPPDKLVDLCKPYTPMGFNDLFCLANQNVHTLSIGAARPSDFDEHVAIVPDVHRAGEAIAPVQEKLESEKVAILGEEWVKSWDRGIPSWEEVPGQLNLYHILRLYGLWKAFDMEEFCKARYNLFGGAGHWFPGFKVPNAEWDALAQAIKGSPFADRIPDILKEAHAAFNKADEKRLSES